MLGLYVSAHPLDGAEHILARNRNRPITDLISSGQTQDMVNSPSWSPASSGG